MDTGWERGLFWFWLTGTIAWLGGIGLYIYLETVGFSLHLTGKEWVPYLLVWYLPPIITFGVFIFVRSIGRKLLDDGVKEWERDDYENPGSRFRRRG